MAEGKKSFIAYSDWKDTFDALPDEKAGQLIKHIFAYVSDENPESDDFIINAVFANIKHTLKRDLQKWESYVDKQRENGKKGGRPKKEINPNNPSLILENPTEPKKADSVSVSESVTVIDTVIKEKVFMFKNSLIDLGIEKHIAEDWLKVRSKKKAVNTKIAFEAIEKEIKISGLSANECIKKSVENSWSGFKSEWLNATQQKGINHPFVMSDEKRNYEQF